MKDCGGGANHSSARFEGKVTKTHFQAHVEAEDVADCRTFRARFWQEIVVVVQIVSPAVVKVDEVRRGLRRACATCHLRTVAKSKNRGRDQVQLCL